VAWRGEDGDVAEEAFDAVVVCNGHCSVPLVPKIRGASFFLPLSSLLTPKNLRSNITRQENLAMFVCCYRN
jgi:hypothetical protein